MVCAVHDLVIMDKRQLVKKTASALATGLLFKLLLLQVVSACPSALVCGNFTHTNKLPDCQYIASQGLSHADQQNLLCILWDQDYGSPINQNSPYPQAQANFGFSYTQIDTSRFILFFKILIFLLFNYMLFALLTRPSLIKKCLAD